MAGAHIGNVDLHPFWGSFDRHGKGTAYGGRVVYASETMIARCHVAGLAGNAQLAITGTAPFLEGVLQQLAVDRDVSWLELVAGCAEFGLPKSPVTGDGPMGCFGEVAWAGDPAFPDVAGHAADGLVAGEFADVDLFRLCRNGRVAAQAHPHRRVVEGLELTQDPRRECPGMSRVAPLFKLAGMAVGALV